MPKVLMDVDIPVNLKRVRDEDLTEEEMKIRASNLKVPEEFTRTHEVRTPENELLASMLKSNDFAHSYIAGFNIFATREAKRQYAEIGFTVSNHRYDFIGVLWKRPTINGERLYPSYCLDNKDVNYVAEEHPILRITDERGRTRDFILNMGMMPVMTRSILCNLHPSNIDTEGEDLFAPMDAGINTLETKLPENMTQERLNNFYRSHNESTTDQVARFILNGFEEIGISFDKQRNSVRQLVTVPGRRPLMRFIAMGAKSSNTIVFYNDANKREIPVPSLQLHVSDYMRNSTDDNYVNVITPFILLGWSDERVFEEIRQFLPKK